MLHDCEQTIS